MSETRLPHHPDVRSILLPGTVWINKPQEPEEPEDEAQKKS
jgi:hypothetical protein